MNQEENQIKNASQSNPFTNAEPLIVTFVEAYTDKIEQLQQAKKNIKAFNQEKNHQLHQEKRKTYQK